MSLLTPIDIIHTNFKTSLRGYNKNQVDSFKHSVMESLDAAIKEKNELLQKLDELQREVDRVRKIESTLSETLAIAQRSADEMKTNAHKQVELILQEGELARVKLTADAQKQIEKYRSDLDFLHSTKEQFESDFKNLLKNYLETIKKQKTKEDDQAEVA